MKTEKSEKKRGAEREQPAVRDEWWTDERVKSYLSLETTEDESRDFHILIKAYRGMTADIFERFIGFFLEERRSLNDRGPHGETILDVVSQHKQSGDYRKVLEDAGAERGLT